MQKGINTNQKLQKCGESLLDSKYLDGGDNPKDVRCNIYDMTGNTMEWSTKHVLVQEIHAYTVVLSMVAIFFAQVIVMAHIQHTVVKVVQLDKFYIYSQTYMLIIWALN